MSGYASYNLSESEFKSISALVYKKTGISLADSKTELVKRRFASRLEDLGLSSYREYIEFTEKNYAEESSQFCNAITTNLTSFFRENHHYEILKKTLIPELAARKKVGDKIRVWSAGCSSGQEAYCLAIMFQQYMPELNRRDFKILGTDLDEHCLATARIGTYPNQNINADCLRKLEYGFHKKSVTLRGKPAEQLEAKEKIKDLIVFNKLNLMNEWPMKGVFDLIFCRNVFIYFDKETQKKIMSRFSKVQKKGDYLFLGHSETISHPENYGYELIGKTQYVHL